MTTLDTIKGYTIVKYVLVTVGALERPLAVVSTFVYSESAGDCECFPAAWEIADKRF